MIAKAERQIRIMIIYNHLNCCVVRKRPRAILNGEVKIRNLPGKTWLQRSKANFATVSC